LGKLSLARESENNLAAMSCFFALALTNFLARMATCLANSWRIGAPMKIRGFCLMSMKRLGVRAVLHGRFSTQLSPILGFGAGADGTTATAIVTTLATISSQFLK